MVDLYNLAGVPVNTGKAPSRVNDIPQYILSACTLGLQIDHFSFI